MNENQEAIAQIAFGDGFLAALEQVMNAKFPYIEVENEDGRVVQYIEGEMLAAFIASIRVEPEDL